jgi:hypothetical protein
VRGDAEDEGLEGTTFVTVTRERGQHSDADLLRCVVSRLVRSGQAAETSAAVADNEPSDVDEERISRPGIPPHRPGGQLRELLGAVRSV